MDNIETEMVPLNCKPRKSEVTFGIWHDELQAAEITDLLSIQPKISRAKGEIRLTKSGSRIVSPTGCWILSSLAYVRQKDCNSHLDWILDQLTGAGGALRRLRNEGYRMQITCCVHVNHWNTSWSLDPDLLRKIGNLQIPFVIDVSDDIKY